MALFRKQDTPQTARFIELQRGGAQLAITDVILTEILQGIRDRRAAQELDAALRNHPILRLDAIDDFVLAADLYRAAAAAGHTVRKSLDCLIAAPCIRADVPILHADRDFDRLASCTELRVFS